MARYDELLAHLAGGGRDAMDRLLTSAQALAYRFGVLVCGNVPDAEDAMQDALLQTYRRAGRIRNLNQHVAITKRREWNFFEVQHVRRSVRLSDDGFHSVTPMTFGSELRRLD